MDNLIGMKTSKFVLIATDTTISSSILAIKNDESKFTDLNELVLGCCGDYRHKDFTRLVKEEVKLNTIENDDYNQDHQNSLSVSNIEPVSSFIQLMIYRSLRKDPINLNYLLMSKENDLIALDNYGCKLEGDYFAFGYSRLFLYGLLDSEYSCDMSLEEGICLLQKCINMLNVRLMIKYLKFRVEIYVNGERRSVELTPEY